MLGVGGSLKVDVGSPTVFPAPNLGPVMSADGRSLSCSSCDDATGNSISPEPKRTVTTITNLSRLCTPRPPLQEIGMSVEDLN